MGRRPLVGMVLAWVAVVLAVATVTFVVVDRAGRGVGQASAARTVAPAPSATPTSTSGMPGTATPTSAPSTSAPSAGAPSTGAPPSGSATRTASFPTVGGTVVASCDGAVIALGSIVVADGWRVEDELEQGELEVKFKSSARDVDDVEIVLGCVDGIPTALQG